MAGRAARVELGPGTALGPTRPWSHTTPSGPDDKETMPRKASDDNAVLDTTCSPVDGLSPTSVSLKLLHSGRVRRYDFREGSPHG